MCRGNAGGLRGPGDHPVGQPVQTLRAGLVAVHFGQPCIDGWVGGDEPVDGCEAEKPRTACIIARPGTWSEVTLAHDAVLARPLAAK